MIFSFFHLLFVTISSKSICVSTNSYDNNCDENILGITADSNITNLILEKMNNSDSEIYLKLYGYSFSYNINLCIFNGISSTSLEFSSTGPHFLDITKITNTSLHITSKYSYTKIQVTFNGTQLKDDTVSLTLNNINLVTEFTEIQLHKFSATQSTFQFTNLSVNSITLPLDSDVQLRLENSKATLSKYIIKFVGENPVLSLSSSYKIELDNQVNKSELCPQVLITNSRSVTIKGNDFTNKNLINISAVSSVAFEVSTFYGSISSDSLTLSTNKSLFIHGTINTSISYNRKLIIQSKANSRISMNIENYIGHMIAIENSFIDVVINNYNIQPSSRFSFPISPCIGFGGLSTVTANSITYISDKELDSSIYIYLDLNGDQTDKTLSVLMSQNWTLFNLTGFTSNLPSSFSLSFSKTNIYGFSSNPSECIISASSSSNDSQKHVSIIPRSYNTIPLIICYKGYSCKGITITNITELSLNVPEAQKNITLIIGEQINTINLTTLKCTGATFHIKSSNSYTKTNIEKIDLGSNHTNIILKHLILDNLVLTGANILNTDAIDFLSCEARTGASISFKNPKTVVYIQESRTLNSLEKAVTDVFPLTKMNFPSGQFSKYDIITLDSENITIKASSSSFGSTPVVFNRTSFPKIVLMYIPDTNSDVKLTLTFNTEQFDTFGLVFRDSYYQPELTISLVNLNKTKGNQLNLDFGKYSSTIDLNDSPKPSYINTTGDKNVKFINVGVDSSGNLCTCKNLPCVGCGVNATSVSYMELDQKVKSISGDVRIYVIGDNATVPTVSLSSMNDKNIQIYGVNNTNPTISVNTSSEFTNQEKSITFRDITITLANGSTFNASNIIFNNCKLEAESFKKLSVFVSTLVCSYSDIVFKDILIKKSLELRDIVEKSDKSKAVTSVSFEKSAIFSVVLPNVVEFYQNSLRIGSILFNLENCIPAFSYNSTATEITYIGNNTDFNIAGFNLTYSKLISLTKLFINGTWTNKSPTKLVSFIDLTASVFIESENSPINLDFSTNKDIFITSSKAGIKGKLTLYSGYSVRQIIKTLVSELTVFSIKELYCESRVDLGCSQSNINVVIENINSTRNKNQLILYAYIDLDGQSQFTISNDIRSPTLITCKLTCGVTEKLSDPKIVKFIEKNHTIIVLTNENIQLTSDSLASIDFGNNPPNGFNNDNFKLKIENQQLILYVIKSPIEGPFFYSYGRCSSGGYTELTNDNLNHLEDFIPMVDAVVTISICRSIESGYTFNFSKNNIKIQKLTFLSSYTQYTAPVLFGNRISSLVSNGISFVNNNQDEISINDVSFTGGACFDENANIKQIKELYVDESSLLNTKLQSFNGKFEATLSSYSSIQFIFTSTGWNIVTNTVTLTFDSDKFPNIEFKFTGITSPKFSVLDNVTKILSVKMNFTKVEKMIFGNNWDVVTSPEKLNYSITNIDKLRVYTKVFPIKGWDFENTCTISPNSEVSVLYISDNYVLNNDRLILDIKTDSISYSNIVFEYLTLLGKSQLVQISKYSYNAGYISSLRNDATSQSEISNVILNGSVILEQGSSLNGTFSFDDKSTNITFKWDLNKVSKISSESSTPTSPNSIIIQYTGSSTHGRESEFNNFLSQDITISTGFQCELWMNKIHFVSKNSPFFNDGDHLVLEGKCTNNTFKLIQIKQIGIIVPEPITSTDDLGLYSYSSETDSDNFNNNSSSEEHPTKLPTSHVNSSDEEHSSTTNTTSSSLETVIPTNDGEESNELSIDANFVVNDTKIIFLKDGIKFGKEIISVTDSQADIQIVKLLQQKITVSTSTDKPEKGIFLSPSAKNTEIAIESQKEGFGQGEIGVHANSNNPSIIAPGTEVPLNIFNDGRSNVSLKIANYKSSILEENDKLNINKLISSHGDLSLLTDESIHTFSFKESHIYKSSKIDTRGIQLSFKKLILEAKSTGTITNILLNDLLEFSPNSQLNIEKNATFSNNLKISFKIPSQLLLGSSQVNGVAQEVTIVETGNILEESEEKYPIICGQNFQCESWVEKFTGNDILKYALCQKDDQKGECLVATNVEQKNVSGLRSSGVAGIIISIIGVVVAAIVIFVVFKKKQQKYGSKYLENDETLNDDSNFEL
ncbi:hypothetical protein TRFO_20277 [Tritrichomonas foetus]|uniref:Uncharacterized protein n=1 Tax=Tritrichomonas foetus TaxID=1144522 RepID=A0A1J4KKZ1_9EUKA|nr:hypothetical protein TRFO_20277 [Tritrichomonas foetus]|eukprot:OHT10460.1 hypothetical protein TRFO_20277 [Tritrichomonas foetus]